MNEWLNKINMTLYEFSTYIEGEEDTYVDDFDSIRYAYKNNYSNSLQHLKEYFLENDKRLPRNMYLSILCDLLISRINKSEPDRKKAKVLEDYLVNCQFQYNFEIALLGNSLLMFEASQILSIMPRIIKAVEDYQALDSRKNELVQIIVDAIILLRIERRSQIWRTVCFTQAIFSVGCMLFLFILYSLIALVFTNRSMAYGSHSIEFFWYWQEHGPSGWETLLLIFLNLMIGMYFLIILQQFVQLFFEDKGHFLIGFIAIIATTLAIERMGIFSNLLEFFYYPFWLNLYTYTFSYWIDIAVKFILIIVIYFSGHVLLDNRTVKRLPTY